MQLDVLRRLVFASFILFVEVTHIYAICRTYDSHFVNRYNHHINLCFLGFSCVCV
jgi:hypothetical protein